MNKNWERGTRAESCLLCLPPPYEPAMVFRFNHGSYVLNFQGHPIGLPEARDMQEAVSMAEKVLVRELKSYQKAAAEAIEMLGVDDG